MMQSTFLLYLTPLAFVDLSVNSVQQICSVLCWVWSVGYGMMPPGDLEFLEVALMQSKVSPYSRGKI